MYFKNALFAIFHVLLHLQVIYWRYNPLLTSAADLGEWSASRPGLFNSSERAFDA
jgi:hypothetical protein